MTSEDDAYAQAMADLRDASSRVEAAIVAAIGEDKAYRWATESRSELEQIEERLAGLRPAAAAGIAKRRELSLSQLANRISVSKTRAAQFVHTAGRDDRGDNDEQ